MNRSPEPMPMAPTVVGVVLSGGESRRLGRDKATVELAGRSLLQHVADGFTGIPVIVVGPAVSVTHPDLTFVREEPPGGGPCAALVAGAESAYLVGAEIVAVVATDMPRGASIALEAAERLAVALPDVDAVVPSDEGGYQQALCAAYRVAAVRNWAVRWGQVSGASVRSLVGALAVEGWEPLDTRDGLLDIDDADALDRARSAAVLPDE